MYPTVNCGRLQVPACSCFMRDVSTGTILSDFVCDTGQQRSDEKNYFIKCNAVV